MLTPGVWNQSAADEAIKREDGQDITNEKFNGKRIRERSWSGATPGTVGWRPTIGACLAPDPLLFVISSPPTLSGPGELLGLVQISSIHAIAFSLQFEVSVSVSHFSYLLSLGTFRFSLLAFSLSFVTILARCRGYLSSFATFRSLLQFHSLVSLLTLSLTPFLPFGPSHRRHSFETSDSTKRFRSVPEKIDTDSTSVGSPPPLD